MKVLLVAINAKYIHTNIAIRYFKEYSKDKIPKDVDVDICEYTINNRLEIILDEIFKKRPDVLCLSAYIWNIDYIKAIIKEYKKISPKTKIIIGGPEVTYENDKFLQSNPDIDILMIGEGEDTFVELVNAIVNKEDLNKVKGLTFRNMLKIVQTPPREIFNLEKLPFAYPDIDKMDNKILYFETSRGCPFKCSYCLSSVSRKVRYMPLPLVFKYLDIFLSRKVKQVKFVDRTFNCERRHTLEIWKYLKEHDNGITNFHFEITAELLNEEMFEFLKTVRKGQFQFEVGVQSTNPQTLNEINRKTNIDNLMKICQKIDGYKNIHLHLDLIAGLPYEDIDIFGNSFDTVFKIRPQQLQLGFLKVLKGSKMYDDAKKHDIKYLSDPPYQVLTTKWLSYDDVLILKYVEEMVEDYYNSGRYANTLNYLLKDIKSPFDFFKKMGIFYVNNGYHLVKHTKEDMHTILKDFYEQTYGEYTDYTKELVLLDICLHEKPKKLPKWIDMSEYNKHKRELFEFMGDCENIKRIIPDICDEEISKVSKMGYIQVFTHDVISKSEGKKTIFVLFDYIHRDLLQNANYYIIERLN